MDKNKIAAAFNKAALIYDQHATVQKIIGEYLLDNICVAKLKPKNILDLGCGTGYFTKKLSRLFPASVVYGIDFAEKMLEFAKEHHLQDKIIYLLSEAEKLPFKDNYSEIVFANGLFQWALNLQLMLNEIYRALSAEGSLFFSMFSAGTLKELHHIYRLVERNNIHLFKDATEMKMMLMPAGFKNISISTKSFKLPFNSVSDLIRYLKNIGANYVETPNKGLMGTQQFNRIEKLYKEKYSSNNKIIATFKVLCGVAQKGD